jgi:hypothetical protein
MRIIHPYSLAPYLKDDELYHPMLMKSETKTPAFAESPFVAPSNVVESKGSPDLEPTGPVPESFAVNYLEVNPMFESDAPADDVFRQLKASIRPHVEEYQCYPDWTVRFSSPSSCLAPKLSTLWIDRGGQRT